MRDSLFLQVVFFVTLAVPSRILSVFSNAYDPITETLYALAL